MHGMLAMYSNMQQSDWASLLPFAQLARNTAYNTTVQRNTLLLNVWETVPHYQSILFWENQRSCLFLPRSTVSKQLDNLQLAYELARQNIGEMALRNESKATEHTIPIHEVGAKVWLHKPHTSADAPNPKLLSPWRGPCEVKERITSVVYRVKAQADHREIIMHIAQLKP
ncbi:unnamed protein product, partial [Choristocarpus tenellus]